MKFLVYTVSALDDNAAIDGIASSPDNELSRLASILQQMDLERVMDNRSISLLVDDVQYHETTGTVTADIYKEANPGSALHQFERDGDEITIEEILSEQDDAFKKGLLGLRKINGEVHALVQKNFGSYFVAAKKGMDVTPHYSAEAIRSIQESETIGRTIIDFDDGYDLTASLFKPPEDGDIREDEGFGNVNTMNKIMDVMRISHAHNISLEIYRDEWLNHLDMFQELIDSEMISTIRIKDTKDGTVRIGDGGERAIRETIHTRSTGKDAIDHAFKKLST